MHLLNFIDLVQFQTTGINVFLYGIGAQDEKNV